MPEFVEFSFEVGFSITFQIITNLQFRFLTFFLGATT